METKPYSLFNVGEAYELPSKPGSAQLLRYPSSLAPVFTLGMAKHSSRWSTGCEVRFVPEGEDFELHLSCSEASRVSLFQGHFWCSSLDMDPGRSYVIKGKLNQSLIDLPDDALPANGFSQKVIRLLVERGPVHFHGLDNFGAGSRAPTAEETPKYRWLAWGSSITHAANGYAWQAAQRLGVDVYNKGLSGSCGAEPEVAEWLVNHNEWDFATCEWGVNMRRKYSIEAFEKNVRASLDIYLAAQKPVFLITTFRNEVDVNMAPAGFAERQTGFNDILRSLCAKKCEANPQLHLIEGCDILKSQTWLTADLLHPSQEGHNQMGVELANVLAEKLDLK